MGIHICFDRSGINVFVHDCLSFPSSSSFKNSILGVFLLGQCVLFLKYCSALKHKRKLDKQVNTFSVPYLSSTTPGESCLTG